MAALKEILGETLKNGRDEDVKIESLNGTDKVVGLYFSAHWCPPCRGFTPRLVEFYHNMKMTEKGENLEIVFISSDRDEDSFKSYFGEMPWLALPYADRTRKAELTKRYKVDGIPAFVLLDAETGAVITKKGRDGVMTDPEGKNFPWFPKPLKELLKGTFLKSASGDTTTEQELQGKVIGLYFSAHWCPPCKTFTPKLKETYEKIKGAGKPFEVVFVSADRSEESFNDYYKEMPWLAVPYNDSRKNILPMEMEVQGIPSLMILDENLQLITRNGREYVDGDPEGKDFPWKPKPVEKLTEMMATNVNGMACMILFTHGEEEFISTAESIMMDAALEYQAAIAQNPSTEPLCFMYEAAESEDMADSIIAFAHIEEKFPQLIILDIPGQKKYCHKIGPVTKEDVKRIAQDFREGRLPMMPLQHH